MMPAAVNGNSGMPETCPELVSEVTCVEEEESALEVVEELVWVDVV